MQKTFQTYAAWRKATKKRFPGATFDGDRAICFALNLPHGVTSEWDGYTGIIETPKKEIVGTVRDEIDSENRQLIWTLFSDGSAQTREITRHSGDSARRTKETYREDHAPDSEEAKLIAELLRR